MAEITHVQKRFLAALLVNRTVTDAIRQAAVSERSAWRWLKDDAFKAALDEAEGQVLEAAMRRLLAMQATAIDALEAVLNDPQARPGDKIRAADLVLTHTLRVRAATTLEERLNELERKIEEVQNGHGE